MSKFLDDARALLENIANGNADDAAVKADIETLKAAVASNESSDAEVKVIVTELLQKLAVSTPPVPADTVPVE